MDDSEMIVAVRFAAGISDAHPDYTDARIRQEINDTMQTVFGRSVVVAQGNYWLQDEVVDLTAGTPLYQMPRRALAQGLKAVEIRASATDNFQPIDEATPYEVAAGDTGSGTPSGFYPWGDFLRLMPKPSNSNFDMRMWYFLRPPKLVQEQSTGLITGVNLVTREIILADAITVRATGTNIGAGSLVDVVSPEGGHEVHLVDGVLSTVDEVYTTIVFAAGTDLSRVVIDQDYLRGADETDWPMLPQEYHRTLADAAAAVMLAGGIGAIAKAGGLSGKVGADIKRFEDLIQPRVKDNVRKLRPRFGAVRQGRARSGRRWPVAGS